MLTRNGGLVYQSILQMAMFPSNKEDFDQELYIPVKIIKLDTKFQEVAQSCFYNKFKEKSLIQSPVPIYGKLRQFRML